MTIGCGKAENTPMTDAELSQIAERVWNIVLDTYGLNVCERGTDGTILYQDGWHGDIVNGVKRIVKDVLGNRHDDLALPTRLTGRYGEDHGW